MGLWVSVSDVGSAGGAKEFQKRARTKVTCKNKTNKSIQGGFR